MTTQFGESFVGEGAEAAHVNTVLGSAGGPVETAWVTALATPREGHAAFVVTVTPGTAARPYTLFVNKATVVGDRHASLTWGAAQAGVAASASATIPSATASMTPAATPAWAAPHVRDPWRSPWTAALLTNSV